MVSFVVYISLPACFLPMSLCDCEWRGLFLPTLNAWCFLAIFRDLCIITRIYEHWCWWSSWTTCCWKEVFPPSVVLSLWDFFVFFSCFINMNISSFLFKFDVVLTGKSVFTHLVWTNITSIGTTYNPTMGDDIKYREKYICLGWHHVGWSYPREL